jgi:hypothetical protein
MTGSVTPDVDEVSPLDVGLPVADGVEEGDEGEEDEEDERQETSGPFST